MTTREFKAICQKGDAEPFLISRYLYRPWTIWFTRLYILAGARSDTATFHSLVAGLAAAGFALSTEPLALLAVALGVQIWCVLDHVDGELARYNIRFGRQPRTLSGEFLDLWAHLHTINVLFATMGLGMYRLTGSLVWPILGIVACNISGSYQRLSLATVLIGALARGGIRLDDPRFTALIGGSGGGEENAAPQAAASPLRRLASIGAQVVLFPGNIFNATLACLGDFLLQLAGGPHYLCRAVFLVTYCAAGLASRAYRTAATLRQLRQAPL